jgi:hypothetical protein
MYSFRIQDPPTWGRIGEHLRALDKSHPFVGEPMITGIEVSLDAYVDEASIDSLAALTALRYRFMQRDVSSNHRFSGRRGRKHDVVAIWGPSLLKTLCEGRNIVIGNRGASMSQRLYVKTTDNNGGLMLPQGRWRSRWELTLQGQGIPFSTLGQAQHFKFESLSRFFYIRMPKESLTDFERMCMDANKQPGTRREAPINRRWYSSKTIADSQANEATYAALRRLTWRMNPKPRSAARPVAPTIASPRQIVSTEIPSF